MSVNVLDIGHYSLKKREWNYRNFAQNFIKMYFIKRGRGIIRYPEREIVLEPERLYLVRPFKAADYFITEEPLEQYFVHFYAEFGNIINIFPLINFHDSISPGSPAAVNYLFERLNQIYFDPDKFLMLEVEMIIKYLLSITRAGSEVNLDDRMLKIKRYEPVLDFIDKNYRKKITLRQMAAIVHLQPNYFSTSFSEIFGVSPVEFVISKKLEEARELLFFTDRSIKEISAVTGFSDEFYFSRIFKKYIGIPPVKYRLRRKI
jgi:AraC-like DNA-binding protein